MKMYFSQPRPESSTFQCNASTLGDRLSILYRDPCLNLDKLHQQQTHKYHQELLALQYPPNHHLRPPNLAKLRNYLVDDVINTFREGSFHSLDIVLLLAVEHIVTDNIV